MLLIIRTYIVLSSDRIFLNSRSYCAASSKQMACIPKRWAASTFSILSSAKRHSSGFRLYFWHDSRVTGRSTGHPIRVLRNDMARKYLELEKSGAPFEELEQLTLGSLRKAVQEGDTKNGSLMAGQIAGMIKEERTCADIISSTVSEAGKLMNGVSANE